MATTIMCDYCNADLSTPTPTPDYRLILRAEGRPLTNIVHAVYIERPFGGDKYFCDLQCTEKWINKKIAGN